MTTATATVSTPLLAGLADLLAKAHRPLRRPLLAGMVPEDRDGQRLLADPRALSAAHARI